METASRYMSSSTLRAALLAPPPPPPPPLPPGPAPVPHGACASHSHSHSHRAAASHGCAWKENYSSSRYKC